ncbi:hypothetical protein D7Y21_07975 [Corallococcus sp. AB045]|nr:hypothetical protein D7Y21_07975 [Corallococcus sp. AB045]
MLDDAVHHALGAALDHALSHHERRGHGGKAGTLRDQRPRGRDGSRTGHGGGHRSGGNRDLRGRDARRGDLGGGGN